MSAFITDLVSSIFVPGPTPSLLVATNASFAALQVVLLCLLIATYSIHFVVLSLLCASLWWSINWFVTELNISREAEAREKEKQTPTTAAHVLLESNSSGHAEMVEGKDFSTDHNNDMADRLQGTGTLRSRATLKPTISESGSRSDADHSTEDEWEKVSEIQ